MLLRDSLDSRWRANPLQTPASAIAFGSKPDQNLLVIGPDNKLRVERNGAFELFTNTNPPNLIDIATMADTMSTFGAADRNNRTIFRLAVKLAESEREVDMLETGEVALYENKNYWGRTWVVDQKLNDFKRIKGLSEQVSSIRIGGHTALTIYAENNGSAGANQELLQSVPSMAETVVKDNQLSGIDPVVLDTPNQIGLTYDALLSQDFRLLPGEPEGEIEPYKAYRTTMRFPVTTEYVDVWGTAAQTIEVGNDKFEIDTIKAERLRPNELGRIVVTTEATGLSSPGLVLRTNTMKGNERIVIFPDQSTHERLATLDGNDMWEAKDTEGQPVLDRTRFPFPGSTTPAQTAVKQIMKSVNYRRSSLSIGESNNRSVDANSMDFPQWQLQFFNNGHVFNPLNEDELAQATNLPIPGRNDQPLTNQAIQQITRDLTNRSYSDVWN